MADEETKIKGKIETTTEVTKKTETTETTKPTGGTTSGVNQPAAAGQTTSAGQPSTGGAQPTQPSSPRTTAPTEQPAGTAPAEQQEGQPTGQPQQQPTDPNNKTKKPEEEAKKAEDAKKAEEAKKVGEQPSKPGEKTGENPNDKRINDAIDENKKPSIRDKYGAAKDKYDQYRHPVEAGKQAGKKAAGKAIKKAMIAAGKAVLAALKAALSALVASIGWPVLLVVAAICIIIIIIFLLLAAAAYGGQFGKTYPQAAGKNNPNVQSLLSASKTPATGIIGDKYHRFDFLNPDDQKFVEDGLVDKRVASALDYLQKLHKRIAVSHIISTYKDMPNDPEADTQLAKNVSAHKDGLAADVTQIDFVYKAFVINAACPQGVGDIVYYGDEKSGNSNLPGSTDSQSNSNANIDTSAPIQTSENIDAENQQLQDLKNQLQETQNQLKDKLSQTVDKEGRQKLEEQIQRLQTLIVKVDGTITKLNNTKAKLLEFEQKLINVQGKLAEGQNILVGLNSLGNQGSYNDIIKIIDQANLAISTGVTQIDNTLITIDAVSNSATQELSTLQATLNGSSADIDAQIGKLETQINQFDGLNNLKLFNGLDFSLPNLDLFKVALDSFVERIKNEAIETIKDEVKQQINDAIGNSLNSALEGIGLGKVGSGELLRLICEGTPLSIQPNTTVGASPAEAIPIKVSWQDTKPDVTHTDNSADESLTTDPRVFYAVYQPEARKKVHQVITELLQMPYDLGPKNPSDYKVTQLITFSEERDVVPFAATLDKLYGANRPNNLGLFSMPESWAQVHIGY